MPQRRSASIGFLLCGMAEEPFWPRSKGSASSRTSVRWAPRISRAIFSKVEPSTAREARTSAWRSRCTIRLEAELLASYSFHLRIHVGVGTDGAGDLAYASHLFGVGETFQVPLHLESPYGELMTYSGGLGVDPVCPANHHRVAVAEGHLAEQNRDCLRLLANETQSFLQLQGCGGVEDVRGGEAEVKVARHIACAPVGNRLGDGRDEGDDVVPYFFFDLVDTLDREVCICGQFLDLVCGDLT